jgi:hypothetical protein
VPTVGGQALGSETKFPVSESHDTRTRRMADLREIYDGHWTRHLGNRGGQTLEWFGKVGVLAGVTDEIEAHRDAIGTMGERFLYYRMPDVDPLSVIEASAANVGRQDQMRQELASLVTSFFRCLDPTFAAERQPKPFTERLAQLADFAARARSPVKRETNYTRDIELVPRPEVGARLYDELAQLRSGLQAIGLDDDETWRVTQAAALDGIPVLRRKILDWLAAHPELNTTADDIENAIGHLGSATKRALEDLTAHRVLDRDSVANGPPRWSLSNWSRERLAAIA